MADGFVPGVFIGMVVMGFLFSMLGLTLNLQPAPDMTGCAREHNVYACELVAVPVVPE